MFIAWVNWKDGSSERFEEYTEERFYDVIDDIEKYDGKEVDEIMVVEE
jgi:hypothetical protein